MPKSDDVKSIEVPAGLLIFDIADRLSRELHHAAKRQAIRNNSHVITEQHVRDGITEAIKATFHKDGDGSLNKRAA